MNIVKIGGSTAQQMFQYAFYLALCQHDPDARLHAPRGKWLRERFRLPHFMLATPDDLGHFGKGSAMARAKSFFKRPGGSVVEENGPFDGTVFHQTDTYFEGLWLDPRYFAQVADAVRDTFTVDASALPRQAQSMIAQLGHGQTVVLHIHEPEGKGALSTDYYNWSIASILQSIEKAHFYVFSTSVAWAKTHLEFQDAPVDYVEYPADKETSLLPYLIHAKHHVIANTLLSWWAAWLNRNDDKMVIAPKPWSRDAALAERAAYLIPMHWTAVPTT